MPNFIPVDTSSPHHGILSGGVLSVNGGDNSKFDISAGIAQFAVNPSEPARRVAVAGLTAQTVTNLATDSASFIFLDSDGTIHQQTGPPTASDFRDYIYLGQLGHSNNTSIANAVPTPQVALGPTQQFQDLASAVGTINQGVALTANGANLNIDITGGTLFSVGAGYSTDVDSPHTVTIASGTAITFRMRGVSAGTGTTTTLDVGNYDAAGTITSLANNKYQNFRCFILPNGNVVIQYGQVVYNSLSGAQDAIPTELFTLRANLSGSAVLLGIITAKSNGTDLSDSADAEFLYATKFGDTSALSGGGGGSGVTDHGALSGLADDDHTQYHNDTRGDARYSLLAHTHTLADVTDSGALAALATVSATEIDNGAVTNAKLADVATATLKGRTTAGTGDPEDLTKTQALALLNVADGADVSPVASVNALTGTVVLDPDDLSDAATTNKFTTAGDISKLAGIETSATADQTGAQIKVAYEAEADTNAFTDAEQTKLSGIETGATADQTGAQIKASYEGEADTNAYNDAAVTKLAGIAAGADVSPVTSVNGDTGVVVVPTPSNSIPFATDPTGVTVSCNSTDQLLATHGVITPADLSQYTQARVVVIRGGTTRAGLVVGVRYSTTSLSLTYAQYVALGASSTDVEISCPTANTPYASAWITLTAGALTDITLACYQRNVSVTGNANFFRIMLELR